MGNRPKSLGYREDGVFGRDTKPIRIAFVLTGVVALMLKKQYSGPLQEVVWNYGGNFAVSFAVYFLATIQLSTIRSRRLLAAVLALLAVELFEATDGFGIMSNVYDNVDFAANAIGIGFALAVDTLANRFRRESSDGYQSSGST